MIIEEGKYYKMRNGSTVGPLYEANDYEFTQEKGVDGFRPFWRANGKASFFVWSDENPDYDIVEELTK